MSLSFNATSRVMFSSTSLFGPGVFTMEWWQYYTDVAHTDYYIGSLSGVFGADELNIFIQDNHLCVTTPYINANFQNPLPQQLNTWVHFAIVKETDNTFTLYCNGVYFGKSIDLDTNQPFIYPTALVIEGILGFIGMSYAPFVGYLYNFAIIPGVVKYNAAFIPSTELSNNNNYGVALAVKPYVSGGQLNIPFSFTGTYASSVTSNNLTTVLNSPGNVAAISTICFVAGTPVLTDAGYIPIDQLKEDSRINGKRILAITQTVTPEKYLACVRKNAIEPGVPSADTVMTLNHRIMFNGSLVPAHTLPSSLLTLVEYDGQTLYNVVLDADGQASMTVNNMTVETLDPENLLAKMFATMKDMSCGERQCLINLYNEYIHETLKLKLTLKEGEERQINPL